MSSSADEREAYEPEVAEAFGGNILSLMWFDKQRGIGIDRRYGAFGGDDK
jgi:hypothetical protein